jgi:NADH-quinone oxidoreductase subunit J
MSFSVVLFYLLATLTAVSAIGVVVTQNIVRAATWLLFALSGTAGIFFLLGADFIGATQLLIYVGGTLVLVVFGVMLTAQGPFVNLRIGTAEWAIGLIVGVLLFGAIALTLADVRPPPDAYPVLTKGQPRELPASRHLGASLLGAKEPMINAPITGAPDLPSRPRKQIAYLLPFEIVSIHLLVVLIGAAYLARAKRRRGTSP